MNSNIKRFMIVIILLLLPIIGRTQTNSDKAINPAMNVPLVSESIELDGELSESFWQKALILDLPYEVHIGDNVPAPVQTQVYLLTTSSHFYIGFKAQDPDPTQIRANFRDRDQLGSDDWLGVVLDTFNDERRSLVFCVSAGGVQSDEIESSDGSDESWDAIWDSAVKIEEWGYSVEMAIPFTALKFQRTEGEQVWGFDAIRRYSRDYAYHITTFKRDRNNNCYLCQAHKIKGFAGADPGRNLEVTPTATMAKTQERDLFPDGEYQEKDNTSEMGIDAKWGITPNMTLNGTINPDFSQIEADSFQMDINEPFSLFFKEKRPFFTEGADYFDTNMNAVYTRMIRNPQWGAKLTGKEGSDTFGAYVVRDDVTNLVFPGARGSRATSLRAENTSSVFRYKKDIGNNMTIGTLATDREGDDYYNRLLGFDGNYRLTNMDRISGQVMYSDTKYPGQIASDFGQGPEGMQGHAMEVNYNHSSRNSFWFAKYTDISADFRADLGFMPMVGFRQGALGYGQERIADKKTWWSNINYGVGFDYGEDSSGNMIESSLDTWFHFSGAMQSRVTFGTVTSKEEYNGEKFENNHIRVNGSLMPTSKLKLGISTSFGDRIDYVNTQQGSRIRLNPYTSYNFGRHLRVFAEHTYERMNVDAGRLYTANISEVHTTYQFNNRSFLRAILQYVDYEYNIENYQRPRDPEFKHLFTQLLFSYKINPQTVLYLGYSDNYYGDQMYDITRNDYTVFAKVGYAFVM